MSAIDFMAPGWSKIDQVMRLVCAETGVCRAQLLSAYRVRKVSRTRQMIAYLARRHAGKSYAEIGRRLGNSDHTSAFHGVRRIEQLMHTDVWIRHVVETVEIKLAALWRSEPVDNRGIASEASKELLALFVNLQNAPVENTGSVSHG